MDLLTLRTALERAWTATTTYCPEDWDEHDPAWGQCAVTSVLLAEAFGGELLQGTADLPSGQRTAHYWNRIDSIHVDLTWRQFPVGTTLTDVAAAARTTLIANRWMESRYQELRHNVELELAAMPSSPGSYDQLTVV
jgi:hypothetical protein